MTTTNAALFWDDDEDHAHETYLAFEVGQEVYAVSVISVIEIVRTPKVVSIPDVPRCISGAVNLRGVVMPVYDLRLRFGLSAHGFGERTVVIIVEHDSEPAALLVDTVRDVLAIPASHIEMKRQTNSDTQHALVTGVFSHDEGMVMLLDLPTLLHQTYLESEHGQA